jgi:FkbM family methyltransferase
MSRLLRQRLNSSFPMLTRIFFQAKLYRRILAHPLNAGRRLAATKLWITWHVGSRLVPGPVAVPFVNDTMLLISPGMVGATWNLYNGLAEFSEMAFLLHALRQEHLFLDVGANVGVYTVLASGAVGARSIALEPVVGTFEKLKKNISLNQIDSRAQVLNVAVGAQQGTAQFTQDYYDATNHIVAPGENAAYCDIQIRTIDEIVGSRIPDIVKIDIEGYELPALEGAKKTLSSPELRAIIIELNGSGARYGFDDNSIVQMLTSNGFCPVEYDPLSRTLREGNAFPSGNDSSIFVRDVGAMQLALKDAPTYRISTGRRL